VTLFESWKRKRFIQRVEGAIANLDRDRRLAIYRLPEDILAEGLEQGYQATGDKVKHTMDLLSNSAELRARS
jgi:hypothetical protein